MSEFGNNSGKCAVSSSEEELPLHPNSPYRFFRTRVYGRLHFVKRIRPEYIAYPVYAAALAKEFEIGYSLEHPHIAKYLRYEDGAVYQEYVDGSTLAELLASDDPSLRDRATAVRILTEILDALGYLHANGIAYLDLKPQNIMLTRIGRSVKIVDLGSCASGMHDLTPGFTREYAAPEQRDDRPADARSDIYQFGLIAREVLFRCGLDKRYGDFIASCVAENPDDRFADAHAALQAFTQHSQLRDALNKRLLYGIPVALAFVFAIFAYLYFGDSAKRGPANPSADEKEAGVSVAQSAPDSVAAFQHNEGIANESRQSVGTAGIPVSAPDATSEEAMLTELKKSIEIDVWSDYSNALQPLIEKFKRRGMTYGTLDKESKAEFDRTLDSIGRVVEAKATEAAASQWNFCTGKEVREMIRKENAKCRRDALRFKL